MRAFLFLIIFFSSFTSFSQKARLEGKVSDAQTGRHLSGVSVALDGSSSGIATDQDGRFILNIETGKKHIIRLSSIGYQTKEVSEIEVTANQVTTLDILMESAAKSGAEIIIRGTARRESAAALISYQKNAPVVSSVISSETIRRSPDRNTGEVLKRTPGASIQDGKFIIVRGLADRYNQAMLNGVLLTSTEPDRKTFSFDLIPSPMIENIIINKAFIPELPGEWAGGLIQVNTKDIPSKGFFNLQIGTGYNTQSTGKDFFKDPKGGKTDWLGIEDGTRGLPEGYTTKGGFDTLSNADKTEIGKGLRNSWSPKQITAPLNFSLQANGGFNTKLFKKVFGGTLGIVYSRNNRFIEQINRSNTLVNDVFSVNYDLQDNRYVQDINWGGLGNISLQLDSRNKVSVKSIFNVSSPNSVTNRSGIDFTRDDELKGTEFTFKQNTFFTTQVAGEHKIGSAFQLKWYGAFNILDGYIPDQRRILYSRTNNSAQPFRAIISNSLSQQSGSRIYQNLSDYIYTGGGDLSYNFNLFDQKQTVKGGYMLQIKDRIYDAKLFANYLPTDNDALKQLAADQIFAIENFGNGSSTSNLLAFDAIKGNTFRYMANTILNAGFIQFDNQLSRMLRIVWGLRVEDFDQLVGSVNKNDPRHTYTRVRDYLPGVNATFKLNTKNNVRVSASQTVIRPELRELSFLNLYDFELNASVQGKPTLERTKVSNLDLRYEYYPRSGEILTAGVFYKYFNKPIEQIFNEGAGGASTFSYQNPEKAISYGAEVEFRKKLDFTPELKNFTLQANAAYIHSRITDKGFNVDRPLQGQSPYLINLGLMYDLEKHGFSATLLYNQIGERIYLVGDISAGAGSPDIYEASRPLLDLQLSKKILKTRGEIRLNVSDIINATQYFYQNANTKTTFQKDQDAYRFTRKFGTTFGLTFNYSFVNSLKP